MAKSRLARLGRAVLYYFMCCLIFLFVFMPLVVVPLILVAYLASYFGIQKSHWSLVLVAIVWSIVLWSILPNLFPSATRLMRRVAGFWSDQN